jgi:hypothetical protein
MCNFEARSQSLGASIKASVFVCASYVRMNQLENILNILP